MGKNLNRCGCSMMKFWNDAGAQKTTMMPLLGRLKSVTKGPFIWTCTVAYRRWSDGRICHNNIALCVHYTRACDKNGSATRAIQKARKTTK